MPKQIDGLFEELEDESTPTLGQEIGAAIAAALKGSEWAIQIERDKAGEISQLIIKANN